MVQLQGVFQVIVRWLCTDGRMHWSGLNLVSLLLFWYLVFFSFCWATFISSSIFTINIHSLSLFFNFYFYRGTSGSLSLLSFSSSGFFSWTSFSVGFFDHFPFPVFDFVGGGISLSDSSLIFDLFSSLFLDLLQSTSQFIILSPSLSVLLNCRQSPLNYTEG